MDSESTFMVTGRVWVKCADMCLVMAHVPTMDAWTCAKRGSSWPRVDRRGRRSFKGVSVWHPSPGLNRIDRILISIRYTLFFESSYPKSLKYLWVKLNYFLTSNMKIDRKLSSWLKTLNIRIALKSMMYCLCHICMHDFCITFLQLAHFCTKWLSNYN
jgi:hypothetical protein